MNKLILYYIEMKWQIIWSERNWILINVIVWVWLARSEQYCSMRKKACLKPFFTELKLKAIMMGTFGCCFWESRAADTMPYCCVVRGFLCGFTIFLHSYWIFTLTGSHSDWDFCFQERPLYKILYTTMEDNFPIRKRNTITEAQLFKIW